MYFSLDINEIPAKGFVTRSRRMLHKEVYGHRTHYAETLQIAESYWKRYITSVKNDFQKHSWQNETKNKLRWAFICAHWSQILDLRFHFKTTSMQFFPFLAFFFDTYLWSGSKNTAWNCDHVFIFLLTLLLSDVSCLLVVTINKPGRSRTEYKY